MPEESGTSRFLNRLKDATSTVASKAKEGVEELQLKRDLSQAYGDLGRATADLVDSGAVSHPDLASRVEKINELKQQLAAVGTEQQAETPTEPAG